jgi:hypothetical protein
MATRHRASLGITEHSGYGIVTGLAESSQAGEVEALDKVDNEPRGTGPEHAQKPLAQRWHAGNVKFAA